MNNYEQEIFDLSIGERVILTNSDDYGASLYVGTVVWLTGTQLIIDTDEVPETRALPDRQVRINRTGRRIGYQVGKRMHGLMYYATHTDEETIQDMLGAQRTQPKRSDNQEKNFEDNVLSSEDIESIRDMTDNSHHGESRLAAAKLFLSGTGNGRELIEKIVLINRLHELEGHPPKGLSDYRFKLYQDLMNTARQVDWNLAWQLAQRDDGLDASVTKARGIMTTEAIVIKAILQDQKDTDIFTAYIFETETSHDTDDSIKEKFMEFAREISPDLTIDQCTFMTREDKLSMLMFFPTNRIAFESCSTGWYKIPWDA